MAMNMTAAVNIKASVDGLQSIAGLQKSLQGVDAQAKKTSGAFGGLRQAASGIGGVIAGIVPAVGIAGIAALGKGAIDAADNLNDLSQRTGVGVESLSRFGAAAEDSGTSIEEVAKAMAKLSRGIVDPASKVNEALKSIGVSSRDARGNIRSVDEIMLDLAARFERMPDGAQKTALAMEVFGKSGANLIPMLNSGRQALESYEATISGDMAKAADQFNDTLNELARSLAGPFNEAITALLPTLTQWAQQIAQVAQSFSQLSPQTQQFIASIAALALALPIIVPIVTSIVTVFSALGGILAGIGPIIAGFAGAIAPVTSALVALGQTLLAVFTGPVGWVALLVAAGVAVYAFRDQIGAALRAIGGFFIDAARSFKTTFVDPIIAAGKLIYDSMVSAFSSLANALRAPFQAAASMIKGIFNGVINSVNYSIRAVIGAINRIVSGANQALARLRLPQIPYLPTPQIPAFAQGGVVGKPTLALVGEGGEREYIIPESKMGRAAANYMAGARGGAVIPAFANGGVVGPATVNITTGPVLQQNGQRYVTMNDLESALNTLASSLLGNNRSAGGRRFQGV